MRKSHEPKYGVNEEGKLFNRASGEVIPDDEPVFIFRACDVHAATVLAVYAQMVTDPEHQKGVEACYEDFCAFTRNHPDRMKVPDTDTEKRNELGAGD